MATVIDHFSGSIRKGYVQKMLHVRLFFRQMQKCFARKTCLPVDILNLFTETRYRTKLTDWWISLLAEDIRIQTEMATAEVE